MSNSKIADLFNLATKHEVELLSNHLDGAMSLITSLTETLGNAAVSIEALSGEVARVENRLLDLEARVLDVEDRSPTGHWPLDDPFGVTYGEEAGD